MKIPDELKHYLAKKLLILRIIGELPEDGEEIKYPSRHPYHGGLTEEMRKAGVDSSAAIANPQAPKGSRVYTLYAKNWRPYLDAMLKQIQAKTPQGLEDYLDGENGMVLDCRDDLITLTHLVLNGARISNVRRQDEWDGSFIRIEADLDIEDPLRTQILNRVKARDLAKAKDAAAGKPEAHAAWKALEDSLQHLVFDSEELLGIRIQEECGSYQAFSGPEGLRDLISKAEEKIKELQAVIEERREAIAEYEKSLEILASRGITTQEASAAYWRKAVLDRLEQDLPILLLAEGHRTRQLARHFSIVGREAMDTGKPAKKGVHK